MIISCPNCSASFNVKAEALGPEGRTVKCSKCDHRWHATADEPGADAGMAEDAGAETEEQGAAAAGASEPSDEQTEAAAETEAADDGGDAVPAETDGTTDDAPAADAAGGDDQQEDALGAQLDADDAPTADAASVGPDDGQGVPDAPDQDTTIGDVSDTAGQDDPGPIPIAPRRPQVAPRKPRRSMAKVLSIFILLLVVAIGGAAFVMKREIMMWMPASQRIYAMVGLEPRITGQGLEIIEPKPKKEVDGNDEILVIEGEIKNIAGKPVDVPLMRGALLDKQGQELHIWTFTAAKSQVGPGEMVRYRTEFRNPPSDAETLDITFTNAAATNGAATRNVNAGSTPADGPDTSVKQQH